MRELTERFLGGRMEAMKLLGQDEAACKVRRLASRTLLTYRRWVAEFLRFHQDRTGRWIHPQEMGDREVEAFRTHLSVNRRCGRPICFVFPGTARPSSGKLD